MATSLGNRKPPKRCPAWPDNGAWLGAGDKEPAGWKAVALPLPHAATPASRPAARNARWTRMVPPRRIGVTAPGQPGTAPAGTSPYRRSPRPMSNKLQTDIYSSQPVRRIQGGTIHGLFPCWGPVLGPFSHTGHTRHSGRRRGAVRAEPAHRDLPRHARLQPVRRPHLTPRCQAMPALIAALAIVGLAADRPQRAVIAALAVPAGQQARSCPGCG